ncbi:glycosyltransferase [Selenomonas sputigena]|uniref:Glycosyltransferase n=1 Tax=Selenomonas sputigena TaxID=69823 RepID=A0ABV3X4V9_9FIRM
MKKIVVSGVNIVAGGMLSVYKDCLREMLHCCKGIEIIALVHDVRLFDDVADERLTYMAFPAAKSSWLQRCYHEYVLFHRLSKEIRPDLWLSMHDMTPRVVAGRQFVYCHNPSPFYLLRWQEVFADWKFTLFVLFYRYLYRINLLRNRYVIVQQDWMRQKFQRLFGISNVVVARPQMAFQQPIVSIAARKEMFFYPVTVHTYKNVEVLCEAAKMLQDLPSLQIVLTMDGSEGKYAEKIIRQYRDVPGLRFIGRQSRERVFALYAECGAMLFPSRLESWGMPLSEFMVTGKPILTANLPYAHEVLDGYARVKFLEPLEASAWAKAIREVFMGTVQYDVLPQQEPAPPYAKNWQELFALLQI